MEQLPNIILCERTQEHDQITLARIYRLAYDVLQHQKFKMLYTPLQHVQDNIDTSHIICLGTDSEGTQSYNHAALSHELTEFWVDMWTQHGLAAWNFRMYLQPDGRVAIVHFDNFGFHNYNEYRHWITMPCNVNLNFFFADSVFPNDFLERIRNVDSVSPVFVSV
jgi:hypothetical protein